MTTATGFIQNLANRTAVDSRPQIAIRPAISPDMIPDAFSSAEDIAVQPMPLEPMVGESAARPLVASISTERPVGKSDNGSSVTPDVKPQKSTPLNIRENNDIIHTTRIDNKKPSISPSSPTVAQVEASPSSPSSPPPPEKAPAEKSWHKETIVRGEKKPLVKPAGVYTSSEQAATESSPITADNNSTEIRQQDKDDSDAPIIPAIPPSFAMGEAKNSAQHSRAETEKHDDVAAATTIIRPDANQMSRDKDAYAITMPHDKSNNKVGFIQQEKMASALPTTQGDHNPSKHNQDNNNTVTINIGRIEVRAVFPQKQGSPAKERPSGISLSQYLKMRSEGKL